MLRTSETFQLKSIVIATACALSLTAAGGGIAEAAQGSWRDETIRWSDYRSISTIFYNNADFNDQTTTLNYSEFSKNHSDVQANHITPLVLRREQNDISSIKNNEITIDLRGANTTSLEYIYGAYISGSSINAEVKGNQFTFYDDLNDQYIYENLTGIFFTATDSLQGQIRQQIEDNSVTIQGGNYYLIMGYDVSGGLIKDNSVTVTDAIISDSYDQDVFRGILARNASQFERNSININNLTITSKNAIGIYVQSSELPTNDTDISFSGNKMIIANSSIGGDVTLIHGRIFAYDPMDEFIDTVATNDNELFLINSDIGGLVSVYTFESNQITERFPVSDRGVINASGVNTVGGLAGYARLVLNVGEENQTAKKAVITVTGNGYAQQDHKEIMINELADPNSVYYLLAASDKASLTFNDLTIGKQSTFYETRQKIDQLTIESNQVLSWENGQVSVSDIPTEDPGTGENPDDKPGTDPETPDSDEPIVTVTDNSKTLSESLLGTVAFLNQGAEFIADEGLASMVDSAKVGEVSAFGAVHGGSSNYKTGSRVDVDSYTVAAGASLKVTPGWIVGGFIEAGWADSDSHVEGTKGKGDHDYYGVGLATRYMVNDAWYVDGSLRIGQASTEFTGLYAGDSAKYDSDAFYVTAHAGTGYVFNLTDTVDLNVYGRYLITYLDGDDVSLHNKYGDRLDMDSTTTHAVRVGGRLTGAFCSYAGWKVGLAYEHVFDGDAESSVNSLNLEVPSLEGDTGIMEVGVTMKPSLNSHWSMDIGAKGYAGDREGVTGSMLVRYAF